MVQVRPSWSLTGRPPPISNVRKIAKSAGVGQSEIRNHEKVKSRNREIRKLQQSTKSRKSKIGVGGRSCRLSWKTDPSTELRGPRTTGSTKNAPVLQARPSECRSRLGWAAASVRACGQVGFRSPLEKDHAPRGTFHGRYSQGHCTLGGVRCRTYSGDVMSSRRRTFIFHIFLSFHVTAFLS